MWNEIISIEKVDNSVMDLGISSYQYLTWDTSIHSKKKKQTHLLDECTLHFLVLKFNDMCIVICVCLQTNPGKQCSVSRNWDGTRTNLN